MAIIRAQAILRHSSGLVRDNAVNTFHFTGDPDAPGVLGGIAGEVRDFYELATSFGQPVMNFMSSEIVGLDIKLYEIPGELGPDGKELPSGPPIYTTLGPNNWNAGARQSAVNLPGEVAVCLSVQGTPGAGVVQRRRRGRIYIGPLNAAASATTGTGVAARVKGDFQTVLRIAAQRLAVDVDQFAEWVVYSRPFAGRGAVPRENKPDLPAIPARPATTVNISELWIDDAFDTQRKRGVRANSRVSATTGEA